MTTPDTFSGKSWELGDELLLRASEINEYASVGEGSYEGKKVLTMIARLALEYRGTPIYVNAANLLVPERAGIGFGPGQMTGELAGFTYSDYETTDDAFQPVKGTGVLMAFEMDKLNGVEARHAGSYRNNVFGGTNSRRFVLGMPVIEGNKVMRLDQPPVIPDSPESLFNSPESSAPYSYREHVDKIVTIMQGRYGIIQTEGALLDALRQEMESMNYNCPYLGKVIISEADYMRRPKADGTDGFKVVKGRVVGSLRKFVYYPMVLNGTVKGDVQAVIYDYDVADQVTKGLLTPQEADLLPNTTYVPLSMPHKLTEYDTKNNL
jgi:hypothetical protein